MIGAKNIQTNAQVHHYVEIDCAVWLPEMSVIQHLHLPTSNWFIYFDCALRFKHNAVWTTVSFHFMSMETNFINLFRTQINRTALLSINPPGPATIHTNWHWHHLNDISMNEMNLANAVTITVPLLSHSICSTAFEMMAIDGRIGFLCKNWFYLQSA